MEIRKIYSCQCAPQDRSVTVKRRKGDYALFSVLSNILQKVLSKRIACLTLLQSLQLLWFPWSHEAVLQRIVTYAVVKKGMENKGRTMMRALKLQRLAKRYISGWSDVEKCRNKVYSLSGYRVMLVWSEDLFGLGYAYTNAVMLSESKYLADFLVGFLGKKPQTLLIPIYSTVIVLPYYMIC